MKKTLVTIGAFLTLATPGPAQAISSGTGSTYLCPTYQPYLHCNVLGSCYCSQLP